ncbi:MAG: tetratricopeptide repeat protein [Gammaproteobacteria bacterium]|nr:tetratricopeptide repeat protein [Gammaproteobacteria bacterium]
MRILEAGSRLADDYEIVGVLGKGGMGIVYLAEDFQRGKRCALKTFLTESLMDKDARENFRAEALLWVNLDRHVNILTARAVREYSSQLYVAMDYIAPGKSGGVTLLDYLSMANPYWDEPEVLRLAIQFCYGMQHAQQNGLRVHRDIKPANILIGPKNTLKIADFGIALPSRFANKADAKNSDLEAGKFRVFSGMETPIAGTPGYMPPEIFRGAEPDIRSDIYGFGLVLAQLACHSHEPPFFRQALEGANFLESMLKVQKQANLRLPLNCYRSAIEKCLEFKPENRFSDFFELGDELRSILRNNYSRDLLIRGAREDDPEHLSNRASSLKYLGKVDEAIVLFERVLTENPDHFSAISNLGSLLAQQDRFDDALPYLEKASRMEPDNATVLANYGNVLNELDRNEEAMECYREAIKVHPDHFGAWHGRSNVEYNLGRLDDAALSNERSLRIYPSSSLAWQTKAIIERSSGKHMDALKSWRQLRRLDDSSIRPIAEAVIELVYLNQFIEADKTFTEMVLPNINNSHERPGVINLYYNEALNASKRDDHEYALNMYGRVLAIEPGDDEARYNRGVVLFALSRFQEALDDLTTVVHENCGDKSKLNNLGIAYLATAQLEEASRIFKIVLELDGNYALALFMLAQVENKNGNYKAAAIACRRYLSLPGLETDSIETMTTLLAEIQSAV